MKMPEAVAWWVIDPDGFLDMSDVPIQYKEERPLESLVPGYGYMALFTESQLCEALAQQEAVMEQALEALEMYALWESPDDPARPATDAIKALEEALK